MRRIRRLSVLIAAAGLPLILAGTPARSIQTHIVEYQNWACSCWCTEGYGQYGLICNYNTEVFQQERKCPYGDVVLGGGFTTSELGTAASGPKLGFETLQPAVIASKPMPNGRGWMAALSLEADSPCDLYTCEPVQVWAVCALGSRTAPKLTPLPSPTPTPTPSPTPTP